MTTEKLITTVKDLEQYLIDVWDIKELFRIAYKMSLLGGSAEGGDYDDEDDRYRKLADQLEERLFTSYRKAVHETNRVLELVLSVEGADILVERTKAAIAQMVNTSERELRWLQMAQGPLGMYANLKMEDLKDPTAMRWGQSMWQLIEGDLSFYVGKVVSEIERITSRTGRGSDAAMPYGKPERSRWNGNASELAYLLTELIEGDHIIPPTRGRKIGKEGNRAAVADAIYEALDIRDPATAEPVTRDYFKSLLRPNSPDRGTYRNLFKITPRPQ